MLTFNKKIIRELEAEIHLCEWGGQCKKFYLTRDRGTLAFWGKFSYSVSNLSADIVKAFMLLAKFGEFAGIGRLTGQGLRVSQNDLYQQSAQESCFAELIEQFICL